MKFKTGDRVKTRLHNHQIGVVISIFFDVSPLHGNYLVEWPDGTRDNYHGSWLVPADNGLERAIKRLK